MLGEAAVDGEPGGAGETLRNFSFASMALLAAAFGKSVITFECLVGQPQVLRFQDSGQHMGHKWAGRSLRFPDKNDEVMDS